MSFIIKKMTLISALCLLVNGFNKALKSVKINTDRVEMENSVHD